MTMKRINLNQNQRKNRLPLKRNINPQMKKVQREHNSKLNVNNSENDKKTKDLKNKLYIIYQAIIKISNCF